MNQLKIRLQKILWFKPHESFLDTFPSDNNYMKVLKKI